MPTDPSPTTNFWPFVDSRGGFAKSRSGAWYRIEGIRIPVVIIESDDAALPVGSKMNLELSTKWPSDPVLFSRSNPDLRSYGHICARCPRSELRVSGLGQLKFRGIVTEVVRAPELLTGDVWGGDVPGGR